MSPVSRKRKKKPTRRRANAPTEIYARIVDSYASLLEVPVLDAEVFTSDLLGTWWLSDDADGRALARGIIGYAARQRSTEALALLLMLARLGVEEALRDGAADAAQRLRDAGVPEPSWAASLGPVAVRRCLRCTDVFGEQSTVVCEFDHDGRRHALVALLDHDVLAGGVADVWFTTEPDVLVDELVRQADEDDGPTPVEVAPDVAAGLLRTGFAVLGDAPPDPDLVADDEEELVSNRALTLARLREMPGGPAPSPAEPDMPDDAALAAIVADFLASPAASGLAADGARDAAETIVSEAADEDGRPLRIGPGRLDRLMHTIEPDRFDDTSRAAFPAVIVAWAEYTAALAELPADAAAELVQWAGECGGHVADPDYDPADFLDDEFHDEDDEHDVNGETDAVLDRYLPELHEPDSADKLPAPEDLADLLARRMFAVPEVTATVNGERFTDLDPADAGDRRVLILAEHPEYWSALAGDADPADAAAEVDGVNPGLHIAAHEIVANQLWDDDPPEAWQAAQRLLNLGMDRMEVLHALASVAMEHARRTISDGTPSEAADYATDLKALGQ